MNVATQPGRSMPRTPIFPPSWIDHLDDLQRMANTLTAAPLVAVDTESNSLFAYQEQTCLIQFSTPQADYLVDPLTLDAQFLKLVLAPIFVGTDIEKVFHAAEYDLLVLSRDFGFNFTNIFDTMLAARVLGRDAFGLGILLEQEFNVKVDKRQQRANWGQRPLPPHLMDYAQVDTHYLIPLRHRLKAELEKSGRWELAQEDFNHFHLENGKTAPKRKNIKNEIWRIAGWDRLSHQKLAVLYELCLYRDQQARAQNRPLFKILSDRTLLEIAEACPESPAELQCLPKLSPRQVQRYNQALLKVVKRGLQAPPLHPPPRPPRPDPDFMARLDALREWRKRAARKMGVESDVILPRVLMEEIARRAPRRLVDLSHIFQHYPWRLAHFGDAILELISEI
jgi:ribonuclease D